MLKLQIEFPAIKYFNEIFYCKIIYENGVEQKNLSILEIIANMEKWKQNENIETIIIKKFQKNKGKFIIFEILKNNNIKIYNKTYGDTD